jgi:hypothetical protein
MRRWTTSAIAKTFENFSTGKEADRRHINQNSRNQKMSDPCPMYAPFFGFAGKRPRKQSLIYPQRRNFRHGLKLGRRRYRFAFRRPSYAAAGTAKAGAGIVGMGQYRPQLIMKALVPIVMASIIAIYGLVVAVLISGGCAYSWARIWD